MELYEVQLIHLVQSSAGEFWQHFYVLVDDTSCTMLDWNVQFGKTSRLTNIYFTGSDYVAPYSGRKVCSGEKAEFSRIENNFD